MSTKTVNTFHDAGTVLRNPNLAQSLYDEGAVIMADTLLVLHGESHKTRLKQESQEIQRLGKRLVALSNRQLVQISLDEPVREAIALAHKIQNKRIL